MVNNKTHKIILTEKEIKDCRLFAIRVVKETYNRFNKKMSEREKRIFIGKMGEIAFLKFLNENNKFVDTKDIYKVFLGETNVDKFDFITKKNKKIDIKTAYKNFHKRIIIPWDQFEKNNAKDYYVGTKLNSDLKTVDILGYTTKNKLIQNGKLNFGEGLGYYEFLNNLFDIKELLEEI